MKSDFTGLAECVQAGAYISTFRVVETWYGGLPDSTFRFAYPAHCGDRFVMALRYGDPPSDTVLLERILRPIGGMEHVEIAWPEQRAKLLPAEIWTSSTLQVRSEERCGGGLYGGHLLTVDAFREATRALSGASGAELEATLIRGVARFYLNGETVRIPARAPEITLGSPAFADVNSLDDVLDALLPFGYYGDDKVPGYATLAIARGGGEHTLARLDNESVPVDAVEGKWLASVRTKLRSKLSTPEKEVKASGAERIRSDDTQEIETAKERLSRPRVERPVSSSMTWQGAFELLSAAEPVYTAEYLRTIDVKRHDLGYQFTVFSLACWFAKRCPSDHLQCYRLLAISDVVPVKAVGALYLSFLDKGGTQQPLQDLVREDGPNGVWAASYLVAHGNKEYVPKAFEGLRNRDSAWQEGLPVYHACRAMLATLSNAATKAEVPPMPDPDRGATSEAAIKKTYAAFTAWWETYQDNIDLETLRYIHPDDKSQE